MTAQHDEPIPKSGPQDQSTAMHKIKPLDHEPATQRPYDPGVRRPQDDDPEEDPWLDTGEPEGSG